MRKNGLRLRIPVRRSLCLALAMAGVPVTASHGQEEIPLNLKRLSDRVLVTWACDYFQGTNMAVVTTAEGLVVIDTGLSPSTVARQRVLVEEELGRSDFRYLVNTHMHNDHAFANQAFPETTVVGPENSLPALRREVERIPDLLERLLSSQASYQEWAEMTSPDSLEGKHAREGVAAFAVGIGDLQEGIQPRYPTMTFSGHHSLDMGDVTFELFEFAGLHSDSDILILIPEERMLFTGDVFWGGQLPLLREGDREGFLQLMSQWQAVLQASPDLETVVTGHSDVPLDVDQFKGMYAYLSRLWEDIQAAREAHLPMRRFFMQHSFSERYPEVAAFNFAQGDYNLHQHNIYVLWGFSEGG